MTSPSPGNNLYTLAQNISTQFASRPTFEQIAQRMLEQAIKDKYPSLVIDLSRTRLATPQGDRVWTIQPFMPRVLDYLALGTPVDFSELDGRPCFLSDDMPRQLWSGDTRLDMKVIEAVVLELPWTVPIGLQSALTDYWNAEVGTSTQTDTSTRVSRWRWLSDVLRNMLNIRALHQPRLNEQAREALDQVVRWPDRDIRFRQANLTPVHAYSLESTVIQGTSSALLPSNEILLAHAKNGVTVYLLFGPGGTVQSFESLDAFNSHWAEHIASRYVAETVSCQRNEIDGDVFDTQAAMILEQQLGDLKAVQLPSRIGRQDLNTLYKALGDPARYLIDAPSPTPELSTQLKVLLPDWIQNASVVDQTKFQQYSLALASAKKRNHGRTFLSDILDIRTFTVNALLEHMGRTNDNSPDKARPNQYQPDDLELTFTVAAGYPGGAGISDKRKMSLTDLAINNLIARPSGHMTLSHRLGLTLPAWLTPDFITRRSGLIEQVDIGKSYPEYLQQKLFDDLSRVQERQRVFGEQTQAQLPLEALKQMLNNENGMTGQGLRLIEALFEPDAANRQVAGQPVVIRHLAFLRKPEARPDIVTNMFMIESQDVEAGPHLLYRPLYAPMLLEFPTRQALLQSVAEPGDLQNCVLTWMADRARPIYANGGFQEPHIVRFLQGDEFATVEKPEPATLAIDGVNEELLQFLNAGKLWEYLYGSNSRALVSQADRDSVSNSESRWAAFLEGSGMLFNTLLFPLLRGPAMLTAWLWSLMVSASHDIPALNSEDPMTRELAAADLLVNLGMLVLQHPSATAPVQAQLSLTIKEQALRSPAPRVVADQWPAPAAPRIIEGTVALPGNPSTTANGVPDFRTLDFSFASARAHRLTPEQRTRMQRFQVPRPALMPEPINSGTYKGLYLMDSRYYALVEDGLYRVSVRRNDNVRIIDPVDPANNGPILESDAQGKWSTDLRLRLRGGMPPKRIAEQRRLNEQKKAELTHEYMAYLKQQDDEEKALDIAQQVMLRAQEASALTEEQRASKRRLFDELLQKQTATYLHLLDGAPERARLGIELPPQSDAVLMGNIVNNARKSVVVLGMDRTAFYKAYPEFLGQGPQMAHVIAKNVQRYMEFLNKMSDINDRAIHWLELKDRQLDKLSSLGHAGERALEQLTHNRPDEQTALGVKALQLTVLKVLSLKGFDHGLSDSLNAVIDPLAPQVRSHSDLPKSDLSSSERLEVLGSLTEHYGQAVDALQGMKAIHGEDFNQPWFDKLFKLIEGLYQDTSHQLAVGIQSEPKPDPAPTESIQTPPGRPQKKMIKTRKSGLLIGNLKPPSASMPIEVVELRSEHDDQLLVTYSRHGDVWDVVERTQPLPPTPTRSARLVKNDVQKLLGELTKHLTSAERYKKHCRFPQEIEEIMTNEANRFGKLCAELERALPAPRAAADQALIEQMAQAMTQLTAKGSALRTELSLQLPPTDGNLQYLFDKALIQVAMIDSRKPMTGARQDFIQEYAIQDRQATTLWYAHFHYEATDTPKSDYTIAHLKTKEQRRESYHSLLAKARNPYAVVAVHRGGIGKALAQRWFLPLAP